jgi:site-specific recombinase XerD
VELLLQTGMRISELANLKLEDLDLDRDLINIETNDTGVNRKVPLNEMAKRALGDYLRNRPRARENTVFLTKTCKPFLIRNIRNSVDRYFRLAGLKEVKVNDLRHTFIVEQLRAGVPLVYVSQLVGHKRITTTEKYLQFVEGETKLPDIKIETL